MVVQSEIRIPKSAIAWVTGGGTGIGRALAEALYRQGWRVVITGRRVEVLESAAQGIRAMPGGEILAISGDAANPEHANEVVQAVNKRWGVVELLVNNAGFNDYIPVSEATLDTYRKSFEINCLSAVSCVNSVLPGMLGISRGVVVNISSTLGKWASSGSPSYSVSKYAVAGYTDVLRQHLINTPIHVLGVYPGFIQTDMTMPHVKPGSPKTLFSKTPAQMAAAILRAVKCRKAELHYPWYVSWIIRLHRIAPLWMDRLARRLKH